MAEIPLGRATEYPQRYAPDVLFAIPREANRSAIGIAGALPFHGVDVWTAWELTWLDDGGKPVIAAAEIAVPADSPNIVESKSLKLYLNSFAMTAMRDDDAVAARVAADLTAAAGAPVTVTLFRGRPVESLPGNSLDSLDVRCDVYDVDAGLLALSGSAVEMTTWTTSLLRSLCPVTSQPDFGTVMFRYRGAEIEPASLLRYVVSFREHQDFHEACVERMFADLKARCGCEQLSVYARYQRRGGLDINPFRSDFEDAPMKARVWNQ